MKPEVIPVRAEPLPSVFESLRAVQLRPGDVVVMTFPGALSTEHRRYWGEVLDITFPDHESLLLDNGIDLAVLRTEPEERPKSRPFVGRQKRAA